MLKIVSAPNVVLSEKAKVVAKIDKDILRIIEEMKKTLLAAKDPEGVGLAAPQVGKSLQIFLIKPTTKSPIQTFINPKIIAFEDGPIIVQEKVEHKKKNDPTQLEGCLSLPNIWGFVKRYQKIVVSYLDEKGIEHQKKFAGFPAVIIQHEMDHLNGDLFPKRVLEQSGKLYKSHRDAKDEDIFEEIEI